MAVTVLLASVAVLLVLGAPHQSSSSRIVGGQDAVQGQFPGVVSLRVITDPDQHACGGAILDQDLILTSAHCVYKLQARYVSIVAGSINSTGDGTARIPAKRIITHENYSLESRQNDISLLLLQTPLTYSDVIQPLKLADKVNVDDVVTALGWGATGAGYPEVLQWVNGKIWSNSNCADSLSLNIIDSQICFGGEQNEGLCYADEGSPLIINGDTTVGIFSWNLGPPCAFGFPDVFTRVSAYVAWINGNTKIIRQKVK